jgi:hypothetical protein
MTIFAIPAWRDKVVRDKARKILQDKSRTILQDKSLKEWTFRKRSQAKSEGLTGTRNQGSRLEPLLGSRTTLAGPSGRPYCWVPQNK